MDEVKIRTQFLRGIIGKLLSKFITKKLGKKITINFQQITIKNYENKLVFDVCASGEISRDELSKIISEIGI